MRWLASQHKGLKSHCVDFIPKYLNFAKGIIDSEDLPLLSTSRKKLCNGTKSSSNSKNVVKKSLNTRRILALLLHQVSQETIVCSYSLQHCFMLTSTVDSLTRIPSKRLNPLPVPPFIEVLKKPLACRLVTLLLPVDQSMAWSSSTSVRLIFVLPSCLISQHFIISCKALLCQMTPSHGQTPPIEPLHSYSAPHSSFSLSTCLNLSPFSPYDSSRRSRARSDSNSDQRTQSLDSKSSLSPSPPSARAMDPESTIRQENESGTISTNHATRTARLSVPTTSKIQMRLHQEDIGSYFGVERSSISKILKDKDRLLNISDEDQGNQISMISTMLMWTPMYYVSFFHSRLQNYHPL